MTDHLSSSVLNALADGELTAGQWSATNQHLAECASCAANALYQSQLKAATAKAGHRYSAPPDLQGRWTTLIRRASPSAATMPRRSALASWPQLGNYGWATACAVLVLFAATFFIQENARRNAAVIAEDFALATEASDQHIAAMASNTPPQVISSDRHTVKPWFQGKLPFSFNLPEDLSSGTTLDGANLAYLHHRPAAQLLYTIGKHRASIYLEQRLPTEAAKDLTMEQAGFHVIVFFTDDIRGVAVSDVEPARLSELVGKITRAQNK